MSDRRIDGGRQVRAPRRLALVGVVAVMVVAVVACRPLPLGGAGDTLGQRRRELPAVPTRPGGAVRPPADDVGVHPGTVRAVRERGPVRDQMRSRHPIAAQRQHVLGSALGCEQPALRPHRLRVRHRRRT